MYVYIYIYYSLFLWKRLRGTIGSTSRPDMMNTYSPSNKRRNDEQRPTVTSENGFTVPHKAAFLVSLHSLFFYFVMLLNWSYTILGIICFFVFVFVFVFVCKNVFAIFYLFINYLNSTFNYYCYCYFYYCSDSDERHSSSMEFIVTTYLAAEFVKAIPQWSTKTKKAADDEEAFFVASKLIYILLCW